MRMDRTTAPSGNLGPRKARRALKAIARKGAIGGAAVLGTAVLGVGGAQAQCRDNTGTGIGFAVPFATGTAISSYISTLNAVNTSSLAQSSAFVGTPSGAKPDQEGGGVWVRGIGGTVETKSNTSTEVFLGGGSDGTINCHTVTKQDFVGNQVGFDIARHNFAGGGNAHLGLTAGYFDISAKDKTPGEGFFSGDFQVPFMGVYGAINAGNLALDAQVRWDFYQSQLTDLTQGISRQELDAKSLSFLWNASYRFDVGKNWFIEPSVGGVWSRTEINPFDVAGTAFTFPGTARIDDVTSLLGRASVRAGTTIVSGNMAWLPFATASVFHEFAGNVTTNITSFGGGFADAVSTTSRVGTYAHVGLGLAGTILNTGWLGYARVDYRAGDNIEGVSVNAGLRYQFAPQSVKTSLKDDHHTDTGRYNWSGLYGGVYGGAMQAQQDWLSLSFGTTVDPRSSSYLVGGQIGYNYQFGHVVAGIEADLGVADAGGGKSCPNAFFFTCHNGVDNLGLVTARLGYAWDRTLFYAKAGLAIADVSAGTSANDPFFGPSTRMSTKTLMGWAYGGGVEFALTDRWSAKAEYIHFDLDNPVYIVDNSGQGDVRVDTKGDTVRVGLNYHFGK